MHMHNKNKERKRLLKAAKIIESEGWTRGQLVNEDGNVCLIGALDLAVHPGKGRYNLSYQAVEHFPTLIKATPNPQAISLSTSILHAFNDSQSYRNGQEVVVNHLRSVAASIQQEKASSRSKKRRMTELVIAATLRPFGLM